MFNSKKWHFGTSLLLSLGMTLATATPLISNPAMAQFYRRRTFLGNQQRQLPNNQRRPFSVARIPAGTLIPVEYEEAEKV
ncbi:MAG: hypothetical protein F6K35_46875, partial [Okeania sp. SIO2H7]|nr:hypothetical protein [Okeania sp. SIO2H7]